MTDRSNLPPAFGRWLKRLRAQHDLTQEALAEKMYCSVQTIRFFEAGKRRPSLEMAERLVDVLQVPPDQHEAFVRQARAPLDALESDESAPLSVEPTRADAAPPPIRVPLPPTPLIGRQAEGAVLQQLLGEGRRLISLVGPGGIGKTRLALQVAHDLSGRYADGAAFVPLAAITKAADIPAAIAETLGAPLPGSGDPAQQIVALLAEHSALLVLDNFEHLLSTENGTGATLLLEQILQQTRQVQLLVTTRERLRLPGEHVFELIGLAVPAANTPANATDIAQSDAVLLFLARAQQVHHHFALTPANQAALVGICRLLEGSPLGIELAASWVRVLTVEEIAAEMEQSINFLALADRNAPARHRSLRAVFDHSWTLLADEERAVLARLAVFRGGFDRAAAREVAGASLPLLAALIDKSLVRAAPTPVFDGALRYDIHELLRQYLLDNLRQSGDDQQIMRRHAQHFTALAEQIAPRLSSIQSPTWQQRLDIEQGNLRTALQWSLAEAQDASLGLRLAAALGHFWYLTGHWKEGRDWLQLAKAQSSDQGAIQAQMLVALGDLHRVLSEHEAAFACLQEGLTYWRAVGDRNHIALTLFQLGRSVASSGDYEQSERYLSESLALYRALGDSWGTATLLNQLGSIAINRGDYARGAVLLAEAVPMLRSLRRRGGMAVALNLHGRAVLAEGNPERAIALFYEALDISLEIEGQEGIAWTQLNLGLAQIESGRPTEAASHLRVALDIYQKLESKGGITAVFAAMAAVAAAQEQFGRAAQLLGMSECLYRQSGQPFTLYEMEMHKRTQEQTIAVLGEEGWAAAWAQGLYLTLDQAVALALA
jgi:predicted ATPase/DNA-binding XRE family transcriptional regulator